MMTFMQLHSRRHSKWRRFVHRNQKAVFASFLLLVIMALVVLLFWALTSPRFAKFN